jgi:hypothetical protein
MNLHPPQQGMPTFPGAFLCLAVLCVVGCKPAASVDQPVPDVRGAPIKTVAAKKAEVATSSASALPARADAAAAAPVSNATVAGAKSNPDPDKPLSLTFDQLAGYTFEVNDEVLGPITNDLAAAAQKTNSKIPQKVKSYDQKKVALRGFMLPLKVEGGLVTEMLIMKDQTMCCYGATPRINDWVSVRMKNKGVKPLMDLPVTLSGTMKVGEMRENGYLVGIYSMEGEELDSSEGQ